MCNNKLDILCRNVTWESTEGPIRVKDMTEEHLERALWTVAERGNDYCGLSASEWFDVFSYEIQLRSAERRKVNMERKAEILAERERCAKLRKQHERSKEVYTSEKQAALKALQDFALAARNTKFYANELGYDPEYLTASIEACEASLKLIRGY